MLSQGHSSAHKSPSSIISGAFCGEICPLFHRTKTPLQTAYDILACQVHVVAVIAQLSTAWAIGHMIILHA